MSVFKYYCREFFKLIFIFPSSILTIVSVISAIILWKYGEHLNEAEKAVLGGVAGGYVFFIFIEVFPKAIERHEKINRLYRAIVPIEVYFDAIFSQIQTEVLAGRWTASPPANPNNGKFFNSLYSINVGYSPLAGLIRISSTLNTNPITFNYSNIGEVLLGEIQRVHKKFRWLEKVAEIYGIDVVDPVLSELISELSSFDMGSQGFISRMQHANNNAAILGTELDLMFEKLSNIKKHLQSELNIEFSNIKTDIFAERYLGSPLMAVGLGFSALFYQFGQIANKIELKSIAFGFFFVCLLLSFVNARISLKNKLITKRELASVCIVAAVIGFVVGCVAD